MKRFDRSDEGNTSDRLASDRLQAFTKAMWDALVPSSGECVSVQGELVRANERLRSELLRNGMANYYARDERASRLVDNHYGKLLVFMLDTLIANRGHALEDDDVAFFAGVRAGLEADWHRQKRIGELNEQAEDADAPELSDAERQELEQLEAAGGGLSWDLLLDRAERCTANWCLANPELMDRQGRAVEEGGIRDVRHVFEPPPAPPPCGLCKGKGWLPPKDAASFPEICACKKSTT